MIKPNEILPFKNNEEKVLDLEKKYTCKLLNIFRSSDFVQHIETMIGKFSDEDLKSYQKSPTDLLFQRCMNLWIIDKLRSDILYPYISPISSDSAFVLKDCVLNIDAKTISGTSNAGDMKTLQVNRNQISFENQKIETASGIFDYETKLASLFEDKPVLSFFLHFHYQHNDTSDFTKLKFYNYKDAGTERYEKYGVFGLICVPNRIISRFFDYDLLKGFKNYKQVTKGTIEAESLFSEKILNNEPKTDYRKIKDPDKAKMHLINSGVDKNLFLGVDVFLTNGNGFNFNCRKTGYMYRWSRRKGANTFGPQEATGTPRIDFNTVKTRYDSKGREWSGVWHWS